MTGNNGTGTKGRDRSHLRVVPAAGLPAPETTLPQTNTGYSAWDPNRTPPSSKLVEIVRELIANGIVRVNTGKSREERFKFTCSKTGEFGWIIVTRFDANHIMVRSNDGQMDIGKPPSFHRTGKREQAHGFIIDVMAHLCQFIGNYQQIKISHELDLDT
ncbi:MAG: hypothetical protein IPG59_12625 [Candidatus Melainabacteria bacterium]|nr:MAG: hypothetical protein IPG59_12625 [Candidatus Melainabacteria bacterium]